METTTTVEKNGLKFALVREETKGKDGKDGIAYFTVPSGSVLAGLNIDELAAYVKYDADKPATDQPVAASAVEKVHAAYVKLLGIDKVIEYVEGRLDVAMRTAQLVAGKDTLTMAEKQTRSVEYVTNGFGRERRGGIKAAYDELRTTKALAALQGRMIVAMMSRSMEKDPAKQATLDADLLAMQTELMALTTGK